MVGFRCYVTVIIAPVVSSREREEEVDTPELYVQEDCLELGSPVTVEVGWGLQSQWSWVGSQVTVELGWGLSRPERNLPIYAFWHCHDFSPIMPNFMPKYANIKVLIILQHYT